jgi:ankyrin repeat protein
MECSISKIRKLLDKGASPNARDEGGMTPLHYAALHGNLNAAEALIKHSDVNARDKDGQTPLHLALEYGHCNVALLLIEFGADVNVADKNGVRPIHYPDDDALVFCGTKYDELRIPDFLSQGITKRLKKKGGY